MACGLVLEWENLLLWSSFCLHHRGPGWTGHAWARTPGSRTLFHSPKDQVQEMLFVTTRFVKACLSGQHCLSPKPFALTQNGTGPLPLAAALPLFLACVRNHASPRKVSINTRFSSSGNYWQQPFLIPLFHFQMLSLPHTVGTICTSAFCVNEYALTEPGSLDANCHVYLFLGWFLFATCLAHLSNIPVCWYKEYKCHLDFKQIILYWTHQGMHIKYVIWFTVIPLLPQPLLMVYSSLQSLPLNLHCKLAGVETFSLPCKAPTHNLGAI